VVVTIMLALAIRGLMIHSRQDATVTINRSVLYIGLIAMESALIFLVWRGIRATGTSLRDLIGGRWKSPRDVIRDILIAIALWIVLILAASTWHALRGGGELPGFVSDIFPRSPVEIALWIALSIAAGVAEEILFRGYCQRQLEALTKNVWIAMVLQAVLFGVSHGYQGIGAMLRITVLALAFGFVAVTRRSLRPGIIAHAWTDIASGILGSR
jgi:uncharacterized protein